MKNPFLELAHVESVIHILETWCDRKPNADMLRQRVLDLLVEAWQHGHIRGRLQERETIVVQWGREATLAALTGITGGIGARTAEVNVKSALEHGDACAVALEVRIVKAAAFAEVEREECAKVVEALRDEHRLARHEQADYVLTEAALLIRARGRA
jgi:hypothetical protein